MPETKYVARRAGLFASLMQATELAGFRLEPLGPVSLRDVYFDTPSGDLLRQGYSLRVREQRGAAQAQLRALRAPAGARAREADATLEAGAAGDALPQLPEGALREMLDLLAGDQPLHALLRLRQDRSPRVVYDGARLVGVISLDVVGYELPKRIHVANEIEIELAGTGLEGDLSRMDPVLRASGLEATTRSKFERGVLRLQGDDGGPVLLLPDERQSLERMLEASNPGLRRRARVVLLASRGLSENLVSARAGLSPARVRHWVERFRAGRLAALREADVERTDFTPAGAASPPAFRVSEIVSRGVPTAAVFRPEHFDPETDSGFTVERTREDGAPADPRGDGAAGDGAAGRPPRAPWVPEWLDGPPLTVIPVEPADPAAEHDPFAEPAPEGTLPEATLPEPYAALPGTTEISGEPVPAGAPVPEVPAEPEHDAGRPARGTPTAGRPALPRPRLGRDTPILHAAADVLGYHHDCFSRACEEVLATGAPAAARKALLAAHRVRLALETFEDFLPERPAHRLHDRLRGAARALDALVDLDDALSRIDGPLPRGGEGVDGPPDAGARERLASRRADALRRARIRLTATRQVQWTRRMERLVALLAARRAAGDTRADFFRNPPDDYLGDDDDRPARLYLRHLLASTVWRRYEDIRAYEADITSGDDARLRPLSVRCAALAFVLGLAADAAPAEARSASRTLGEMEASLGALHRVSVDRSLGTGVGGDPGRQAVEEAWTAVNAEPFRALLAAIAAAV